MPVLLETDYQPVATLLAATRRHQRLANEVVRWLSAHTVFSDIERRAGLSDDPREQRAFVKIVTDLITTGRSLLDRMGADAPEICARAETSEASLDACLRHLEIAKNSALGDTDPALLADFAKLDAYFSKPPA